MGTDRVSVEYRRLLNDYVSYIYSHFGNRLRSVCLFGSVARGEATPTSDIDVLVVAEDLPRDVGLRTRETNWIHIKLRETESYQALKKLGRNCLISDIFLTPQEVETHPPILLDMIDDGVIFYDKDNFLKNALEKLSEKLKQLGAKKIKTEKGHYWILKPDAKPSEVVEI
ncbi:MAG: nucleotidyltransferase domain-containing protein [Candidatus Freyarchaeota archaeon]|nr:nucleotidyltransferase domain-containing protein [Candidatus Jordarchaeia archaeon]MBS7267268.1 nucleotidyltransferase domain-containing protein [Candidatus Jordarchaeia archaeon]MBS7280015.1 nucleotidyltransferase domain-containing protein [Candidatus Jordarchaeia archaeon]